jgi:hypothetical protein
MHSAQGSDFSIYATAENGDEGSDTDDTHTVRGHQSTAHDRNDVRPSFESEYSNSPRAL